MLGVFHHPEDVAGLVNGELEVTRPDGASDTDVENDTDIENMREASYVAH